MKPFHQTSEQIAAFFKTNTATGLTAKQVQDNRSTYGLNVLPSTPPDTWLAIFVRQFKSPLIYILIAAAAIIFFVEPEKHDAFIVSAILLFNAIIGTVQEGRAQNILAALEKFIHTHVVVLRDGQKISVDDSDLVPGDIMLVQAGQRIPADARIIESNNLQIDEAVLTGESGAIFKTTAPLPASALVADQENMLFKGTYILAGSGKAIVTATGTKTEIGKIHASLAEIEGAHPLKKEIDYLSYGILIFVFIMCSGLFILGLAMGKPFTELLTTLSALFICVIPEGLPVVLSLVLASGVFRLAKQHVLIKNLQAVEGLGRADVIIIDKTGTITFNELMVSTVCSAGHTWHITGTGYNREGTLIPADPTTPPAISKEIELMAHASSLLNSAEITHVHDSPLFEIKGDPTEAALYIFSQKAGIERHALEHTYEKLFEIPFSSSWQYHAGFYRHNGTCIAFITGTPEALINRCTNCPDATKDQLYTLLQQGLRTVAIATKHLDCAHLPAETDPEKKFAAYQELLTTGLHLLGFLGIEDTLRPHVRESVESARKAGLHIVMATGDHLKTATYMAQRAGIFQPGDRALEGVELDTMSDAQLMPLLDTVTVYARVSPAHKLRVVNLFHKRGAIVAMTGDGINDAPSLVAADLGIGMGVIGTEVAKKASDMILLDDSFASIITALEQGRYIFNSLKRVVLYFFATNLSEILTVFGTMLANLPLPLNPPQILWLNLITDGFLDVALSMEPQNESYLTKRIGKDHHLVERSLIYTMLFMALPMAIGATGIFYYYTQHHTLAHAQTMVLITLALFQWFNAWNCRSLTASLFSLNFFANRWLLLATAGVFMLQLGIVYIPAMQHLFGTVPLSAHEWLIAIAISSSIVFLEEMRKYIVKRRS